MNKTKVLSCLAIAGVFSSTLTGIKATPKAMAIVEEAKKDDADISKKEIIKKVFPVYIPTFLTCTGTIACIFGAQFLNQKTQASMTAAYALLREEYESHKEELIELFGEDSEELKTVHKNMAQKVWTTYDLDDDIYGDPDGETLFYDMYARRYFRANVDWVIDGIDYINSMIEKNGCADLNDFYDYISVEDFDADGALGWTAYTSRKYRDGTYVAFSLENAVLDDGLEVVILDFETPILEYMDYCSGWKGAPIEQWVHKKKE